MSNQSNVRPVVTGARVPGETCKSDFSALNPPFFSLAGTNTPPYLQISKKQRREHPSFPDSELSIGEVTLSSH